MLIGFTDDGAHRVLNRGDLPPYSLDYCLYFGQFGVCYAVADMNKWLHHNSFSYKKPKGVPHRFDEAKQQEFADAYKALKSCCGKEETILIMYAIHPTLATKLYHGCIRTKKANAIETTGSRSRLKIVVASNLSHIGRTAIDNYESINNENIVRLLCKLRESCSLTHKIHFK